MVVKERKLSRDILQCAKCKKECLICLSCSDATVRRYQDGADKRCFVCSGMIPAWEQGGKDWIEELSKEGHCSWCFSRAPHRLVKHNTISRNDYVCSVCSKKTLQCKSCDNFTRAYSFMPDRHCLECSGVITDWDDPLGSTEQPDLLKQVAWCSWCIEKTDHKLDEMATIGRNKYSCTGCGMGTVECKTKSCEDGMAKTGATTNDDFCIKCEVVVLKRAGCPALSDSLDWETMRKKKLAIVEKNSGLEVAKREIRRESNIRDAMKEEGLERPFLLLCSMAPEMRNVVACSLGFSLYTCPVFGTVHLEAHAILKRPRQGMQTRVEQSYEKLNPLAGSANWYLMLKRVIEVAFHQSYVEDLSKEESRIESGKPFSPVIHDLELEMLMHVADLAVSKQLTALGKDETRKKENLSNAELQKDEKMTEVQEGLAEAAVDQLEEAVELRRESEEQLAAAEAAKDPTSPNADQEDNADGDEKVRLTAEEEEKKVADRNAHVRHAVSEMVSSDCTDEELNEAIDHVRKMLVKNAGIQQEDLVLYTFQLSMACASLTGVSQAVLGVAVAMAPALLASASMTVFGVLAGPLLLVSLVGLASGAIQMGFGSSEGRLLWPIAMLLNQRLLLAMQDININDYYTAIDVRTDDQCEAEECSKTAPKTEKK